VSASCLGWSCGATRSAEQVAFSDCARLRIGHARPGRRPLTRGACTTCSAHNVSAGGPCRLSAK